MKYSFTLNWTEGDEIRKKVSSLTFAAKKSFISKLKSFFERELDREIEKIDRDSQPSN